jgi:outer membrane protein assembly factor BamD (BamD/ComL family)
LRESLANGYQLLARADYDGAMRAFQNVVVIAKEQPPADAALFHMGLIQAHPNNTKKDAQRALSSFDRVVDRYPESSWIAPAKAWIGVIKEAEAAKKEIERTKQDAEKSKQEAEKSRVAAERAKQDADKARLELEKSRQEFEKAKQMIERSKQIDIEIEQKRRARGR